MAEKCCWWGWGDIAFWSSYVLRCLYVLSYMGRLFNVRVSDVELGAWRESAAGEGVSVSVWARRALNHRVELDRALRRESVLVEREEVPRPSGFSAATPEPSGNAGSASRSASTGVCRSPRGAFCKRHGVVH
jgi:hypothetical protein